jgi:hypothetical protein
MYVDFSSLVFKPGATSGRTDTIDIVDLCAFHIWDVLGVVERTIKWEAGFRQFCREGCQLSYNVNFLLPREVIPQTTKLNATTPFHDDILGPNTIGIRLCVVNKYFRHRNLEALPDLRYRLAEAGIIG